MSARSLNKVMLIGNLTRDPNLRYTPNGTAVCSFAIATNRTWVPSDGGEKQEKTDFHNLVSWAKLAEVCGQLLHKGDKIYVEGRIQNREYQNKEGQQQRISEVVVENMILLSSRGQSSYQASQDPANLEVPPAEQSAPAVTEATSVEDVSDDIPF